MREGVVAVTVEPSGVCITGEEHTETGGIELQHDPDESDRILLIPRGVLGSHTGSVGGWVNQCVKVSQQQAPTRTYFT